MIQLASETCKTPFSTNPRGWREVLTPENNVLQQFFFFEEMIKDLTAVQESRAFPVERGG